MSELLGQSGRALPIPPLPVWAKNGRIIARDFRRGQAVTPARFETKYAASLGIK